MDTRGQFLKAMMTLLKKYTMEKITTDMILEESTMSKSSFYRYFADKYELMTACYTDYADKIIQEHNASGWETITLKIMQFEYDNKELFTNIFKLQGQDAFCTFLYNYKLDLQKKAYMKSKGIANLTTYETYIIELYCSGVICCEKRWVDNGMDIPPNQMTQLFIDAISELIKEPLLA